MLRVSSWVLLGLLGLRLFWVEGGIKEVRWRAFRRATDKLQIGWGEAGCAGLGADLSKLQLQ